MTKKLVKASFFVYLTTVATDILYVEYCKINLINNNVRGENINERF